MEDILNLFGVKNPISALHKYTNSSLDIKTYSKIFSNKNKPQKRTMDIFFDENPNIKNNTFIKDLLGRDVIDDSNVWSALIMTLQKDPNSKTFFPISRKIILEILSIENKILNVNKNISVDKQVAYLYETDSILKEFLTPKQIKKLLVDEYIIEECWHIVAEAMCKTTLYIAAHIDAEYSYSQRNYIKNGREIGKVSVIKDILPIFENDKFNTSTEMLFKKWKKSSGKSYTFMQNFISVSGWKGCKADSQKRKFLQWRKGEKIAKHEEIINIVRNIFPEEYDEAIDDDDIIIFYRVSIFLTRYVDYLLKLNKNKHELFKSDKEVVKWLENYYSCYYKQAYSDVELYFNLKY